MTLPAGGGLRGARATVVVPAHNEEQVIGSCLAAIADEAKLHRVEVLVVANGCSDRTVVEAEAFADQIPGLRIIELAAAGKAQALNSGDQQASASPRIYLDADICLSRGALTALVDVIETSPAVIAAPMVRFDDRGASWAVRAFYDVFRQLPYASRNLTGLGVYALSASARSRFEEFPDIISDDLFVQLLFDEGERVQTAGDFSVRTPRRLKNLVDVRVRVAKGNLELAKLPNVHNASLSSRRTTISLAAMLATRPGSVPAIATYVYVVLVARLRARTSRVAWLRDNSSRNSL